MPEQSGSGSRAFWCGHYADADSPARDSVNTGRISEPAKRSLSPVWFVLLVLVLTAVHPAAGLSSSELLFVPGVTGIQPGMMVAAELPAVSDQNYSREVTAQPVKSDVGSPSDPVARADQVPMAQISGDSAGILLIIIPLCMVGLFCLATWGILLIRSWLMRRPDTALPVESD
jgi:hypothetical protein